MQRRDALLTILSTAAFASLGCSGGGGKRRIAVIPKGESHDFWKSVHFGAAKAGEEFDVDIVWQGTADEKDNLGQRKIVDNLISQQVNGICLAPINKTTAGTMIDAAKRQNIPVVIFDSGVKKENEKDIVSYAATDNKKGGQMAGEHLAKQMNGEGGVILLRYQAGSESTEQREEGFLEVVEDRKRFPKIEILEKGIRVDSSVADAQKQSESLLSTHLSKVKGVFTVCEPNNKGMYLAMKALIEANKLKPGQVKFVAFDSDPRMIEGLQDGLVDGVVLQDPVNMGYQAVKTMVAHLDGKTVEKRVQTGVYLAKPEYLDKMNKDYKRFQELLKPQKFGE